MVKSVLTVTLMSLVMPLAGGWTLSPEELDVRPEQRYLLLATTRTSTMQQELSQAARLGFRVLRGAPSGDEVAFFLERTEHPFDSEHYVLLATSRPETMDDELNEMAARGYRLMPETVMWVDCEIVVLMERAASEDARFEYRVLSTSRTSTMQREVHEAASAGFELVAMESTDDNLVVMER